MAEAYLARSTNRGNWVSNQVPTAVPKQLAWNHVHGTAGFSSSPILRFYGSPVPRFSVSRLRLHWSGVTHLSRYSMSMAFCFDFDFVFRFGFWLWALAFSCQVRDLRRRLNLTLCSVPRSPGFPLPSALFLGHPIRIHPQWKSIAICIYTPASEWVCLYLCLCLLAELAQKRKQYRKKRRPLIIPYK